MPAQDSLPTQPSIHPPNTTGMPNDSTIRPFEWLTSPASLKSLLLNQINPNSQGHRTSSCDGGNDANNAASNADGNANNGGGDTNTCSLPYRRALHVGSGSSLVGELLVEEMQLDLVVNVDKDVDTLKLMKQRWDQKHARYQLDSARDSGGGDCNSESGTQSQTSSLHERLQFVEYDFDSSSMIDDNQDSKAECLWSSTTSAWSRLPPSFSANGTASNPTTNSTNIANDTDLMNVTNSTWPYPPGTFDLVLDKSTLDCTLCSDKATANLLALVYDQLAIGGIYIVISFHEIDLLLPLLERVPGSDWTVSCTSMQRQVEDISCRSSSCAAAPFLVPSAQSPLPDGTVRSIDPPPPEERPQANNAIATNPSIQSPLNVLIARKHSDGNPELRTLENLMRHVHAVNDEWFQQQHPLVTRQRIQELEEGFASENTGQGSDGTALSLSLEAAFPVLFTVAEREHLTFEHFLEDWHAFCDEKDEERKSDGQQETATPEAQLAALELECPSSLSAVVLKDRIDFATAVAFLEAMQ